MLGREVDAHATQAFATIGFGDDLGGDTDWTEHADRIEALGQHVSDLCADADR